MDYDPQRAYYDPLGYPSPQYVPATIAKRAMDDAARLSGLPATRVPPCRIMSSWDVLRLVGRSAYGAYNWLEHYIVLSAPWDASDPENYSTLVHEMVHALQRDYLGGKWMCTHTMAQTTERQAYAAQLAWFRERGLPSALDTISEAFATILGNETGIPWYTPQDRENALKWAKVPPSV